MARASLITPATHDPVSVESLTGPQTGDPDVAATVTSDRADIQLGGGGPVVEGYTLNDTSPGPLIRATEGDLVEVRLVNGSVPDGVTLHWHGVDLPNAEDGVAGVTQDAVPIGGEHVYRFIAPEAGTYWYHSHQVSHEQVRAGLFGTLIIDPATDPGDTSTPDVDLVAAVHTYDGRRTVNGNVGQSLETAEPGSTVRVRVVNTDAGPLPTWVAGAPYRVTAVDARDLNEPTDVESTKIVLTAGGRVDLEFTMPADGSAVRIGVGGGADVFGGGTRGRRRAGQRGACGERRPAVVRDARVRSLRRVATRP